MQAVRHSRRFPLARRLRRLATLSVFTLTLATFTQLGASASDFGLATTPLANTSTSSVKISAHLTKTSFPASQVSKVKLVYKLSRPSKSFAYSLTRKSASSWKAVKIVKRRGTFKGSHTMSLKQVFSGHKILLASYRLRLSASGGHKLLTFKVIKENISSRLLSLELPVVSGTPTQGQTLTTTHGLWSGSPTSFAYQWQRCNPMLGTCIDIPLATSSSYLLTLTDVGSIVRSRVTATNSQVSRVAWSRETSSVIALPPVSLSSPEISGNTREGQVLSSTTGTWSNSPKSYTYQWLRCNASGASCSDISGASSNSYVLVLADVGYSLRAVVTAHNSGGLQAATSNQTAPVVPYPPANTSLPEISGTAREGQLLSTTNGIWNNSPTSYTYQWLRCNASGAGCSDITAATTSSYKLISTDIGVTIRVIITTTNASGDGSATSGQYPATGTVLGNPPENNSLPIISGIPTQGNTLTFTNDEWGHTPTSYTYQWRRCNPTCVDISGATNSSYLLTYADAGKTIRIVITASNAFGSGDATSNQYPVVDSITGLAPVNNVLPAVSGTTTQGSTLTTTHGTWANSPTSYTYKWQRCFVNCNDIPGATNASYILTADDVDFTLRVIVKATNPWGHTEATSNETSAVITVEQISVGAFRTCALISNGHVKCWGYNNDGQLGDGTITQRTSPVTVLGIDGVGVLENVTEITTGDYHACALISDGTVDCWGGNSSGQLGNGTLTRSLTPTQVVGVFGTEGPLTNVMHISAGENHTCAIKQSGTIYCWGANDYGQLGNGASGVGSYMRYPALVSGITDAMQVSAGWLDTCALLNSGTVKCWGYNGFGELGIGNRSNNSLPQTVPGVGGSGTLTNVNNISATGLTTCAVIQNGSLDCWGIGNNGEIGNGSGTDSLYPAIVSGVGGSGSLANVTGVTTGSSHVCALTQGGGVDCWGLNGGYGMLGNNSSASSPTPVNVLGVGGSGTLTNVTQISTSLAWHTCALLSSGGVNCWGNNDSGQLGNGGTGNSSTPVSVIGLP